MSRILCRNVKKIKETDENVEKDYEDEDFIDIKDAKLSSNDISDFMGLS